jgi:hypothetical protein
MMRVRAVSVRVISVCTCSTYYFLQMRSGEKLFPNCGNLRPVAFFPAACEFSPRGRELLFFLILLLGQRYKHRA